MLSNEWKIVEQVLKKDGIAVIPTDTLYGIVGSAFSKKAVERIYKLKGRDEKKPCIVLISSFSDLRKFNISLSKEHKEFLNTIWPGKVSVILPVTNAKFSYLHRGTKTIAFRMISPRQGHLYNLIKRVGPIVAPSANPQGAKSARNRKEARAYFGENVDAYICYGTREGKPSTLVSIDTKGMIQVLREGVVKIKAQKK